MKHCYCEFEIVVMRAWKQFVDAYANVIQMYACRRGLQNNDAADVTQEVMQQIAAAIDRFDYDSVKGRFRGWLYTLARNQVINFQKHHGRHRGTGDSAVHEILASQPAPEDTDDWDAVYQQQLMTYAMRHVKREFADKHWRAFELTAIDNVTPAAAQQLRMSIGAIYVAKSRAIARLREFVADLDDDWDKGTLDS